MKKLILSTVITMLAVATLTAQSTNVPDSMLYQTVIRDAEGKVLTNKNIGVKITITEKRPATPAAAAGDIPIFVETHTITTNEHGVAIIKIGSGSLAPGQFPTLGSIWWAGGGRKWLKVEIDPTGGTNYSLISGESQLLTVPYAFHANTAVKTDYAEKAGRAYAATVADKLAGEVTVQKVGDLPLVDVIVLFDLSNAGTYKDALKVEMIGKTFTIANATDTQTPMKLLAYTPTYIAIKDIKGKLGEYYHYSVTLNGKDIDEESTNPFVTKTTIWQNLVDATYSGSGSLLVAKSNEYTNDLYVPIDISSTLEQGRTYSSDKESRFMIGPFVPNPAGGKNIIKIHIQQQIN